jgi:putative nucleotidyltransferase with HDIG domain
MQFDAKEQRNSSYNMLTPDKIRERVQSIIQLPALPTVALEVIQMVDNPKTSASTLGKLISSDQSLTAKVLKIANSPFYGFPKKISTVDFAIIILGFDALKEIVISISLVSSLQKKSDSLFDGKAFWDHAIVTGVIARRLARDLGYRVSGEVFVGGLLHDMGISILHRYFTNEFRRIVEIARESDLTFLEAEESVLQITHAHVGGWLAERWNLPDHLGEAITQHHCPGEAKKNKELVALVHCADVLASRINNKSSVEFDKGVELDPVALSNLKLDDPNALDKYVDSYRNAIQEDIDLVMAMGHIPNVSK